MHKEVLNVHNFNPRPRKEGDPRFIVYIILRLCISIHALVKRATQRNNGFSRDSEYFNPRPRKEGDQSDGAHTI